MATIKLACFTRGSQRGALRDQLCALGHDVQCIKGEIWLTQLDLNAGDPTVLFVDSDKHYVENVHSILSEYDTLPVLVIFSCDFDDWSESIVNRCYDFAIWPCHLQELRLRLENMCSTTLPRQKPINKSELIAEFCDLNMIGRSPVFLNTLKRLKKIARCDAATLIEGETGTGKEMAARAIHYLSDRRDFPFVPVNCGAVPDNLFENELFGHQKGAFTDAKQCQAGLVKQANRGTLLLDEVDALTTKAQVALLRFLQNQEYRALGSSRIETADIRIITATNKSINKLKQDEAFRDDLLYRINIVSLELPPLRERTGDVELLAYHFMDRFMEQYRRSNMSLHPSAIRFMNAYSWPGNVRELENLIQREVLLSEGSTICLEGGGDADKDRRRRNIDRRQTRYGDVKFCEAKSRLIEEFERSYLSSIMLATQGNVTVAAQRAGKERRAFGKLLKKHNIDKSCAWRIDSQATAGS